jgi:hypothetical protein
LDFPEFATNISRYHEGQGHLTEENSTEEQKDDANEAVQIEAAILRQNHESEFVRGDVYHGHRELVFKGWDVWIRKMTEKRMQPVSDNTGDTIQIQSPSLVGCSMTLSTSIPQHDPMADMSSSPKPLTLVLSCLLVMGINVETIGLPIFKIWKPNQLEIGECGLTALAGSIIYDGGLNELQPGGNKGNGNNKRKFDDALEQIFHKRHWAHDNMVESLVAVKKLQKSLNSYHELKTEIPILQDQVEELVARREQAAQDISALKEQGLKLVESIEAECTEAKKTIGHLTGQIADYQMYQEFENEVDDWMEGKSR